MKWKQKFRFFSPKGHQNSNIFFNYSRKPNNCQFDVYTSWKSGFPPSCPFWTDSPKIDPSPDTTEQVWQWSLSQSRLESKKSKRFLLVCPRAHCDPHFSVFPLSDLWTCSGIICSRSLVFPPPHHTKLPLSKHWFLFHFMINLKVAKTTSCQDKLHQNKMSRHWRWVVCFIPSCLVPLASCVLVLEGYKSKGAVWVKKLKVLHQKDLMTKKQPFS